VRSSTRGQDPDPAEIIKTRAALTDEERAIINTHTIEGERLLSRSEACSARSAESCARATSAGTAPAIPTGSRRGRSRDRPDRLRLRRVHAMTSNRPYRAAERRRGGRGAAPAARARTSIRVVDALARLLG